MIHTRERLEEIEDQSLAPYAVRSKDSKGRQHPDGESGYRTAFQRDRDRIIHTTAFRRLEYKTQVKETFEGDVVWEGDVYVFGLMDHPSAKICYAWSSPIAGSDKRRFYAVIYTEPIKSAEDAVRASIVSDAKDEGVFD